MEEGGRGPDERRRFLDALGGAGEQEFPSLEALGGALAGAGAVAGEGSEFAGALAELAAWFRGGPAPRPRRGAARGAAGAFTPRPAAWAESLTGEGADARLAAGLLRAAAAREGGRGAVMDAAAGAPPGWLEGLSRGDGPGAEAVRAFQERGPFWEGVRAQAPGAAQELVGLFLGARAGLRGLAQAGLETKEAAEAAGAYLAALRPVWVADREEANLGAETGK
jgi:hypothetical protein